MNTKKTLNADTQRRGVAKILLFLYVVVALGLYVDRPSVVHAQEDPPQPLNETRSDKMLGAAKFDQRLDAQVPGELQFRDEAGTRVALGDYFGNVPTVLVLAYYNCPNLCPLTIEDLVSKLRQVAYTPGTDFNVVAVGIDPREAPRDAIAKRRHYLQMYGRSGTDAGWHFLTGDEASIRRLADTVGFQYAYDDVTKQYSHPSGVMLLTPEGRVSRYLFGLDYTPTDLRLALIETSAGRIGTPIDKILLRCYAYNSETGKYNLIVMNVVRIFGLAMTLAVGSLIFLLSRRERKGDGTAKTPSAPRPEAV